MRQTAFLAVIAVLTIGLPGCVIGALSISWRLARVELHECIEVLGRISNR
jgi:hypothetical protein